MDDTAKYLIHAAITADGVVERSDVVGAVFGQTEGLLGDDLDLRDLQQSSKVGRIDVQIESENGQSFGNITIASSLDKVKTSILAASLETITRVGPCQASVSVTDIEDVREAKRREIVERAKELLADSFDDSVMTSSEILEEVRESVRIEDITEYEGLPAGPRVLDSDAVIVVEGRADVLTLLRYGIKNAIAVEGTNVPDAVATLSQDRTVTAFLDGDRGGELILRELTQVGDVDYVAFAPDERSVEDLSRHEVMSALRNKVPFETLPDDGDVRAAATDESVTDSGGDPADPRRESPTSEPATPTSETDAVQSERTSPPASEVESGADLSTDECPADPGTSVDAAAAVGGASDGGVVPDAPPAGDAEDGPDAADAASPSAEAPAAEPTDDGETTDEGATTDDGATTGDGSADGDSSGPADEPRPRSLREHVREVIDADTGRLRLLDADLVTLEEVDADAAFDTVADAEEVPHALVLDGELSQRLLDVSAQRGVDHVVAVSTGEFVKRPVGVRVVTADRLVAEAEG
jgi:5S rRNA maturation endonuclease (ribonuclease M5)